MQLFYLPVCLVYSNFVFFFISDATMYGYGPADGITLLYYVALTLMLTSCIEDIIQVIIIVIY